MNLLRLYETVASMRNVCAREKNKIRFYSDEYRATAAFYDLGGEVAVELEAVDLKTDETVFYLQLPGSDRQGFYEGLQRFTDFLCHSGNPKPIQREAEAEKEILPVFRRYTRILITCTSGFSSNFFAGRMRQALGNAAQYITVDAVDFAELEKYIPEYDTILLAPQVAWQYRRLKERYGAKIQCIPADAYAVGDVVRVLREIQNRDIPNYPAA